MCKNMYNIYMCMYIYVCVCMCVCTYIYKNLDKNLKKEWLAWDVPRTPENTRSTTLT